MCIATVSFRLVFALFFQKPSPKRSVLPPPFGSCCQVSPSAAAPFALLLPRVLALVLVWLCISVCVPVFAVLSRAMDPSFQCFPGTAFLPLLVPHIYECGRKFPSTQTPNSLPPTSFLQFYFPHEQCIHNLYANEWRASLARGMQQWPTVQGLDGKVQSIFLVEGIIGGGKVEGGEGVGVKK